MHVLIYTDGSSRGNPGPGGYGTILEYTDTQGQIHIREYAGGFRQTTNNRMELLGVITGLEALNRPCQVDIYSDSQYVVRAFNEAWIQGWIQKNWKLGTKNPVKNIDLWKRLLAAMKPHEVRYNWVKGHAGHPQNERCDALATQAADGKELQIDAGYEEM